MPSPPDFGGRARNIFHAGSSHYAMNNSTRSARITALVDWGTRLVVSMILLQTLYFKFTGAPESVHIFSTLGQEPWGRYGSGVLELVASALLFIPGLVATGALLACFLMAGAVFFHLTVLGVVVQDDRGLLFTLALVVLAGSTSLVWRHRRSLPVLGARL